MVGSVRDPIASPDFSSFLLQAQASKAKVVGLANAGGDTVNAIKQANEFGMVAGGQKISGLLLFITDVHSLGLDVAQGLVLTEAFAGISMRVRVRSRSSSPAGSMARCPQ